MGIPYSRQINAAFEQVNPLVADGFEVLQATQKISLLLAEIQVITTLVLISIFLALLALIICVNPDLETERKALVTPVVKYIASFAMTRSGQGQFGLIALFSALVLTGVAYTHWYYYFRKPAGNMQPESAEISGGEDDEAGGQASRTE